jgi:hypothetical protein
MATLKLTGRRCECPACNQLFNSVFAFDAHRVGAAGAKGRRCLTVAELTARGWRQCGPYWRTPPGKRAPWAAGAPPA